jgi:hypothetical protein
MKKNHHDPPYSLDVFISFSEKGYEMADVFYQLQ